MGIINYSFTHYNEVANLISNSKSIESNLNKINKMLHKLRKYNL